MVPVSTRTVCISIGTVHPFCQRDEGVPKPGPHTHILKLHCNKDLVPGIRIDRHRHGTFYTLGTHSVHDIAKLLFYQYFYISPFLSFPSHPFSVKHKSKRNTTLRFVSYLTQEKKVFRQDLIRNEKGIYITTPLRTMPMDNSHPISRLHLRLRVCVSVCSESWPSRPNNKCNMGTWAG